MFLGALRKQVRRGRNAVRRLRSGLPLQGAENVSPEVPNDLFQAHLSIYHFFARFVEGRRVLDIGCGTGYGTAYLRHGGASAVVGVDRDRRSIAYARSHYAEPGLEFLVGDAEVLPPGLGAFGTVVSSNVFEHLHDPARALDRVRHHLLPEGQFLLVVPPILDAASLAANHANPFHRSNLFVWEWTALLSKHFGRIRAFRHLPPPGSAPSFTDPFPSSLLPADFEFLEVPVSELGSAFTLGAVFVGSEPNG